MDILIGSNADATTSAAIALLVLEESVAENILKQLTASELKTVCVAMQGLTDIDATSVLRTASQFIEDHDRLRSGTLFPAAQHDWYASVDEDTAYDVLEDLNGKQPRRSLTLPNWVHPAKLWQVFSCEPVRVIANLLLALDGDTAALVFASIPNEKRAAVVADLRLLDVAHEAVFGVLDEFIAEHAGARRPVVNRKGWERAGNMVRRLPGKDGAKFISSLEELDDAIAAELKGQIVRADTVFDFSGDALKVIVSEVPTEILAKALHGRSSAQVEKVLSLLPTRLGSDIREELDAKGTAPGRNPENIGHDELMAAVWRLLAENRISLSQLSAQG
ncbi:FliG C-terminal domain-containing protein [Porphyrobacter sp. GA68]|uniref:FliG C-terminal domain-containing protein n=1 Tax=Porphyrobacter sp. GA68 TaxID=2883480 RepID=UPI001D189169|nr:FliG C-terminal domain-containing protein [Porphyrobacter sp. GA68]